jgi:hypothetical protein
MARTRGVRLGTVYKGKVRLGRVYKGGVRAGAVRKESGRTLWVRVRPRRAQRTGERALRTGKTARGFYRWKWRLERSIKGEWGLA